MKYQRIIFFLEDGRRKYCSHNGEIELWNPYEIENLKQNFKQYGNPAYTADFSKYDIQAKKLRHRYPKAKIIKIIGFDSEDHDQPINPQIIF